MERERTRVTFTVGELGAIAALLLYGVGALAYLSFGTVFLELLLVLGGLAAVPVRVAIRRRRARLAKVRRARRAARVAGYARPELEWLSEPPSAVAASASALSGKSWTRTTRPSRMVTTAK